MLMICFRGPILFTASSCLYMSRRVNFPLSMALTSISSAETASSARSTSAFKSPIPSSREMNPSGSNRSRSSTVSPLPMKTMPLWVSATAESAPPPRAVPSIFVTRTPSIPIASWNRRACSFACWPSAASITSHRWSAREIALMLTISSIRFSSRACRPWVSMMITS